MIQKTPTKTTLTQSKRDWAENRDVTLRGLRLNYNASQEAAYRKALRKLVSEMTRQTKISVNKLFESNLSDEFFEQQNQAAAMDKKITVKHQGLSVKDRNRIVMDESLTVRAKKLMSMLSKKFQKLFDDNAPTLAETMTQGAIKTSTSNLQASLKQLSGGLTLKTSIVPEGMEDVSKAIVNENVSLIKSIPSQYFTDVTGAVMRSITFGNGVVDLIPQIQKYNGQTERRARNIALDQTRKAYNTINRQKMQSLGVKQFEWLHSAGSQHPRKSHIAMSGNVYSFDDLPVINKEQVDRGYEGPIRGIPGQAINCRCTMTPVIVFDEGEE